ncbi:MAG: DUF1129 domain-containing protein [Lactobacillaceae bacterium]|jgi:uncharacterized membrane-anchored protein|nr:DUF1129 domain-containing protein [Lactobacillaceae bacterium]
MANNDLSKKNEDYLFRLKKELSKDDKIVPEKLDDVLKQTSTQLLEGQKQGKTAVQLFGTVSEYVLDIKDPKGASARRQRALQAARTSTVKQAQREDPMGGKNVFDFSFKTEFIDTTLTLAIMFSLFYAVSTLLSGTKQSAQAGLGVISILGISLITGALYTMIARYVSSNPKDGASKKPIWIKIVSVIAMIVVWLGAFLLMSLIPSTINIPLNPIALAAIAAILFAIYRWWKPKSGLPKGLLVIGPLSTNATLQYREKYGKGVKK